MQTNIIKNDARTINGWAMFDWANSSYALVISTAIFPIYFNAVCSKTVNILGQEVLSSSIFSYAISLAYFILALTSPILSGIADYGGNKKSFLRFFTMLGAIACMSMIFFKTESQTAYGLTCFILATIGFSGGLVFYNAYLPEIVTEDRFDKVSARGFAFGYVGSVILLIMNLIVIQKHEWFGIATEGAATPYAFLMVGIWWLGFSQITFNRLPSTAAKADYSNPISKGLKQFSKVWNEIKKISNIKYFLFSFLFYNAGVQTVIFLATTFAKEELKMETAELISIVLLLQIVGIGGAYLFAAISDRKGNKISLTITLVIWALVCVSAFLVQTKTQFYGVAFGVGLVMGGVQSLSRATYSKLIPEDTQNNTSFFSFMDIVEKSSVILGSLSFGLIGQLTGNMRWSALTMGLFFIIGLIFLYFVKMKSETTKTYDTI
jgi:UMF1 family MFS transporter